MTYDINIVLSRGLNIVYGLTDSQIAAIEQQIYEAEPEYKVELSSMFEPVKLGPIQLKSKKTIAEQILRLSKTPKVDGKDFLKNFVFKHAKALGCEHLMNRLPQSLSIGQRYRVSLITDAIDDNKSEYLYKDLDEYNNTVNTELYFSIFNWFNCDAELDVDLYYVIWLTHVPEEELMSSLKEAGAFRENLKLYAVENGELVNKTGLLKDVNKKSRAELNDSKPVKVQKPAEKQEIKTPLVTPDQKPQKKEMQSVDEDKVFTAMYNIVHVLMGNMDFKGDSNKLLMDFFASEESSEFFFNWAEKELGNNCADVFREVVKDLQTFENSTLINMMTVEEAESQRNFLKKRAKDKIMEPYNRMKMQYSLEELDALLYIHDDKENN